MDRIINSRVFVASYIYCLDCILRDIQTIKNTEYENQEIIEVDMIKLLDLAETKIEEFTKVTLEKINRKTN